jgi:N-acetylmuramoyl-L-alanine amidase
MSTVIKNDNQHTNNIYSCRLFLILIALLIPYTSFSTNKVNKTWVIVIDAGHGGKDPGAVGSFAEEKNITLAIALKTGEYIEQNLKNTKVVYTRKNDTFVEVSDRANIANRNKADLFISIHANWAPSKKIQGTETFIMGHTKDDANLQVAMKENEVILLESDYTTKYEGFDPKSPESYIMFTLMQNIYQEQSTLLASKIQSQFKEKVSRTDRGVKQAGFWVLYMTTMPSVLIETGFITHTTEEKFLNSKQGQDYLASAIFRACRDYIDEIDSRSGISAIKSSGENTVMEDSELNSPAAEQVVFMVQIAASGSRKELKPENFKGLQDIMEINENERFKYASGSFTEYSDAVNYRKKVELNYPDAFVIAVKANKTVPLQEALEQKKNK